MANYFARKAGNINATDVWATTPSGTAAAQTFVAGDVLYANGFTITVNVDTNLGSTGEVRNDNTNSATAGGSFTLSNGVTLTANAFAGSTANACIIYSGTAGNSATLVGNVTAGSNISANGANNTSAGTLNITGNVTANISFGANNNSTGTLNITGSVTAGSSNGAAGARNNSTGTLNITGNATGGSDINCYGAANASTGTLNITGNATGGSNATAYGANNASAGTLNIVGSAIASNTAIGAVNNAATGILSVIRAIGNDHGIGAPVGRASVVGLSSANVSADTRAEELEYGANGQAPTSGAVRIVNKTNNKCLVDLTTGVIKTLADPSDGTGQANQSDVRSGVSYALGNRTGTCAVPAASSVAFGVAVDNTTGTAALTPAAVWDALTSGMTTAGSIGERLKNAATVDTTGQALADALSPN